MPQQEYLACTSPTSSSKRVLDCWSTRASVLLHFSEALLASLDGPTKLHLPPFATHRTSWVTTSTM